MCSITPAQVKADGQTIATALENISTLLRVTNPTVADDLDRAAKALLAATENWTSGSAKAVFDDAAQAVEAVLAQIPATAPYAAFVAIAVAALDLLIANIGTPEAPITTASVRATMARIEKLPKNPYRGKAVIIHHHFHSLHQDFLETWNGEVEKAPEVGIAKLAA